MAESSKQAKVSATQKRQARGRRRSIKVAALNITTHPHSPERYVELLRKAKDLNTAVRLHGRYAGRVGHLSELENLRNSDAVYGELHRYFDLQPDGRWYDESKGGQADPDDVAKMVILENLKPDYDPFRFVFFPTIHRLVLLTYSRDAGSMSPNQAKKILDGVFSQSAIRDEFGEVDVVVEPDRGTTERIFKLKALRRLEIEVRRPNPDDLGDVEREVMGRLNDEGAAVRFETLVAPKGESLTPTEETKKLAMVAASNGHVTGTGRDEDNRVKQISTLDHPWVEVSHYRTGVQSERDAFIKKAFDMFERIKMRGQT